MSHDDSMVTLGLEQRTTSPRLAREAVQRLLGDEAAVSFTRDALLLTSELVSNAVLHTSDGCQLSASYDGRRQHLRVEVNDTSSELPAVVADDATPRDSGHGLRLVSEFATRWGAISLAEGKTVWFELS